MKYVTGALVFLAALIWSWNFYWIFLSFIIAPAVADHNFITVFSGNKSDFQLALWIDLFFIFVLLLHIKFGQKRTLKQLLVEVALTLKKYVFEILKIGVVLYISIMAFSYQYTTIYPQAVLLLSGFIGYFLIEKIESYFSSEGSDNS